MEQDWIPQKVRGYIYRALTLLYGLELIFDLVDGGTESKLLAVAALFGFSLAAVHTPTKAG